MDFKYIDDKEKCWYRPICNKKKCSDFCLRHYKMDQLVQMSLLEGKQRQPQSLIIPDKDANAFKRLSFIKEHIKDFVDNGNNLLIYSKFTGNGKTTWSQKLLLSYLDAVWQQSDIDCRALFIQMPKFMYSLKDSLSNDNDYYSYIKKYIDKVDLVIWDELNYKDLSQFEHDYLLDKISYRLSVGKSNIYTTNYDLNTIANKLGTRLASRIIGQSENIELLGRDYRAKAYSEVIVH